MKRLLLITVTIILCLGLASAAEDADKDTVSDKYDVCLETPRGETIVDPVEHVDYAGCTCEQIKELLPEENECVVIFCHETALTINQQAKAPKLVDCPQDECDGVSLVDYPSDGYSKCVGGAWTEYSCEPTINDCSFRCGCPENYTAPQEEERQVIVANVTEEAENETKTVIFDAREPQVTGEFLKEPGQPLIIFLIPLLLLFVVGMLLLVAYFDD